MGKSALERANPIFKTTSSRAQVEASYPKHLEETSKHMKRVERETNAATNTKRELKEGIRDLVLSFKEFLKAAQQIGMTLAPDVIEVRLASIQRQLQEQHKIISESVAFNQRASPSQTSATKNEVADITYKAESKILKAIGSMAKVDPTLPTETTPKWTDVVKRTKKLNPRNTPSLRNREPSLEQSR